MSLDLPAIVAYASVFLLMIFLGARRPALGVAGLVAIDPFSFYRIIDTITIALPKTALIGMLIGTFLRRPRLDALVRPAARSILLGAVAIMFATALSAMQAEHLAEALRETVKALEYFGVFAVVILAMSEEPNPRAVRVALALVTLLVSALACAQLFTGTPSQLPYAHHPIPRIAGPLEGPNQLSGYLGLMLPIITAFVLLREPLFIELAALTLGTIALPLTFSRAGALTSLAAIALVIVLAPSARRRSIMLLITAATCTGMGIITILGELIAHNFGLLWRFSSLQESEDPGSVGKRSQLWQAAIALWRLHPWWGIGAGNFELEISKVGPSGIKTHANSLYLQSLVEGGIPLLGAQMYTIIASIITFARASLREPLILGVLVASIGLALHQIVDLLVFYPKIGGMWWILLGLGASQRGLQEDDCRISSPSCSAV